MHLHALYTQLRIYNQIQVKGFKQIETYRTLTINQQVNLANYCGGEKILLPPRFQHCGGKRPHCPAVPTPLDYHGLAVSWSLIFSRPILVCCLLFADEYVRRCHRIVYVQEDAALSTSNEHDVTCRHILSASLATAEVDERIVAFVHQSIRIVAY